MAYYFIANINIQNEEEYQKYIDKASEIFSKFDGKYLAVDNSPKILEGKWNYTRSVIITFPSKEQFNTWYYSNEYQNILKHRLEGAMCDTILVKGK
jgi:uncharacterized protein (DUF1330 family)